MSTDDSEVTPEQSAGLDRLGTDIHKEVKKKLEIYCSENGVLPPILDFTLGICEVSDGEGTEEPGHTSGLSMDIRISVGWSGYTVQECFEKAALTLEEFKK